VLVDHRIPDVVAVDRRIGSGRFAVERLGSRTARPAAPLVDQLVSGDPDQPGDRHRLDGATADLADRREERVRREVLGERSSTAARA
jgi:hypothetical protein